MRTLKKIMDEIIVKTTDIKLLLSKLDVSKKIVPDRTHPKILGYL